MEGNTTTAGDRAGGNKTKPQASGGRGGGGGGGRDNHSKHNNNDNNNNSRGRGRGRGRGGRLSWGNGAGRGRGQGRGQGRGGGRGGRGGRHQHHHHPGDGKSLIKIYTNKTTFLAMHGQCQAAKYKVHKLGCTCDAMKSLIKKGNGSMAFWNEHNNNNNHNNGTTNELAKHDNGDNHKTSITELLEYHNGILQLLVIPQIKYINWVYLCGAQDDYRNIEGAVGSDDDATGKRVALETRLRHELFSTPLPKGQQEFKVSCAACLLTEEPNGFACILSSSYDEMVTNVRNVARQSAREVTEVQGLKLHADHAHHVVILPRAPLLSLLRAKTRAQKGQSRDEMLALLSNEDVPISPEMADVDVKLGHHLSSLLRLPHHQKQQGTANAAFDRSIGKTEEETYYFVMVYDDTSERKNPCWTLDLPGGKRHLGETALQGAMRETKEETSLQWDKSWLNGNGSDGRMGKQEFLQSRNRIYSMNRYYLLRPTPPPSP